MRKTLSFSLSLSSLSLSLKEEEEEKEEEVMYSLNIKNETFVGVINMDTEVKKLAT